MSHELAQIERLRPLVPAALAQRMLETEGTKGCCGMLAQRPVALEPAYRALRTGAWRDDRDVESPPEHHELGDRWVGLRVWPSPLAQPNWGQCEAFLRQLSLLTRPCAFEILGQRTQLTVRWLCERDDLPLVQQAFLASFPQCALTPDPSRWQDWEQIAGCSSVQLLDLYPPPPYSHLLTRPTALPVSPVDAVIQAVAACEDCVALYQVLLQPVAPGHDWHANVRQLLDAEYLLRLLSGGGGPLRFAEQTPSGERHGMAMDVSAKAHDDKPFFAAALRLAVLGAAPGQTASLLALSAFSGMIQHGGRPLLHLTQKDYLERMGRDGLLEMLALGQVYRSGFLVNSEELSSLVHMPSAQRLLELPTPQAVLDPLGPAVPLGEGCYVGDHDRAGQSERVCIPLGQRHHHTHIIGKPGQGKSLVLEHMALDDIIRGHGVAVLDPHSTLIDRLLDRIPAEHFHRVVLLSWGDPGWIPIWNPMKVKAPIDRVASEMVRAFRTFVDGWGDRLEHLLLFCLLGLLRLPEVSLLDVANALRHKSPEARLLRQRLRGRLDEPLVRAFWEHDLEGYTRADLHPPQHKLSKILAAGPAALTFSQRDSLLDLRQIIDGGGILLVDLGSLGSDARSVMGCLILSLIHAAAIGRTPQTRNNCPPFHVHVDEAHMFITDAVQELITEMRKFHISLTLAHHYLSQFGTAQADALASVGTSIIFNVDTHDAQYLCKDLQQRVEVKDIITLKVGGAIARVGTEVARIRTRGMDPPLEPSNRQRILDYCRQRYYRPVDVVRSQINAPPVSAPLAPPLGPAPRTGPTVSEQHSEELLYDEFEWPEGPPDHR